MMRLCVVSIKYVPVVHVISHRNRDVSVVYQMCQYNYQQRAGISFQSIVNFFTRRKELVDAHKLKALEDLKAAMNELTVSSIEEPSIYYDHAQLLELSVKPVEDLTINQLEELGRAYFDGIDNVIEVNQERAFTLWMEAATRGSIDSKYVVAVCRRDGTGVTRDLGRAMEEFLAVADQHGYGLAHVCLIYSVVLILVAIGILTLLLYT